MFNSNIRIETSDTQMSVSECSSQMSKLNWLNLYDQTLMYEFKCRSLIVRIQLSKFKCPNSIVLIQLFEFKSSNSVVRIQKSKLELSSSLKCLLIIVAGSIQSQNAAAMLTTLHILKYLCNWVMSSKNKINLHLLRLKYQSYLHNCLSRYFAKVFIIWKLVRKTIWKLNYKWVFYGSKAHLKHYNRLCLSKWWTDIKSRSFSLWKADFCNHVQEINQILSKRKKIKKKVFPEKKYSWSWSSLFPIDEKRKTKRYENCKTWYIDQIRFQIWYPQKPYDLIWRWRHS